jgi:hypothetical protein
MLNATEPNGELSPREPEAAREQISLIEMSDEEILSWLTTSILDEPEPVVGERGVNHHVPVGDGVGVRLLPIGGQIPLAHARDHDFINRTPGF